MAIHDSNGARVSGHSGQHWVSIGVLSKHSGLSRQILRNYEREGILDSVRTPGGFGHRRYHLPTALKQLFGLQESTHEVGGAILAYARVSGRSQAKAFDTDANSSRTGLASDLSRQVQRLRDYAIEHYDTEPIVFSDVGSGLFYERRNFTKMLQKILAGEFQDSILLLTYKERLVRFGFGICELLCRHGGVTIKILDKDDEEEKDLTQEITDDVVSLLTHAGARINGRKAAKTNSKTLKKETIEAAIELFHSGKSWWAITDELNARGDRTEDGSKLTYYLIHKYVIQNLDQLTSVVSSSDTSNSFSDWAKTHLKRKRGSHVRLATLHDHYSRWCQANNVTPLTKRDCGRVVRRELKLETSNRWSGYTEVCDVELQG